MSTPDTWYAYFEISGSFDPDEITQKIGVSPTYAIRSGKPGRYAIAKCSRWELRSRLKDTDPLEDHVRDVLDQLDNNESAFRMLSRDFDGTMQLVGYFKEHNAGVNFERRTVERIARYTLAIDCDFYNRS